MCVALVLSRCAGFLSDFDKGKIFTNEDDLFDIINCDLGSLEVKS